MGIPVVSAVHNDWSNMTDEEFMAAAEQFDESEISVVWENLKSTDNVKVGEKSIKFMSSGNI